MKIQCVRIGSEIPTIFGYVDIRIQAENYEIYTWYQGKESIAWNLMGKKVMNSCLCCPSFYVKEWPAFCSVNHHHGAPKFVGTSNCDLSNLWP